MSVAAPETGLGFPRRAESLHAAGRTEEALAMLLEGMLRHPDHLTGMLVLARVCEEAGRSDEALEWLKSALRADPDCPAARLRLAGLLRGSEHALHLEWLAAREPWDEGFWAPGGAPGGAEESPGRAPQTARTAPLHVEEDEPEEEDAEALPHVATVTLAEIYFQQGLKEQAAQIYRQLLERQPGDASARRRLEEIETSNSEPARG